MTHPLGICLWFDKQAKEAFTFYESVFPDIKLISENPFTVNYTLAGKRFMHLNGGPEFKINPSISFFTMWIPRRKSTKCGRSYRREVKS
jgi:predicted 3-demethylubiquinone-9 3-methyltransferase (glyoxalase superfamily)